MHQHLNPYDIDLNSKVETKDALLHAINEEYVEAVEVLLDHEESIHQEGELWVQYFVLAISEKRKQFTMNDSNDIFLLY